MYYSLSWDSLYHVSRFLLNMLCITHSSDNFSWNASCLMFFVISKGLYLFWSSFFKDCFDWIFFASNYILSSCFNLWGFCIFLSNCFFMVSFAFFINVVSQILYSSSRKVSSFSNSVFIIKSLFYECLPKLSSNSIYPMVECFLSSYRSYFADNYSIQSFCW